MKISILLFIPSCLQPNVQALRESRGTPGGYLVEMCAEFRFIWLAARVRNMLS